MFRAALIAGVLLATPLHASAICIDWPYSDAGPEFTDLLTTLGALRTNVPALVRAVDALEPELCLGTDPSEAHGTFEPETVTITVQAELDAASAGAVLLHELRHLDQAWRGICLSPDLGMRDNARAVFALEADAMAVAVLAAWTLAEDGMPGPWQALGDMPESSDIAQAFAAGIAGGDAAEATAEAFSAWYGSDDRRERYYVATCEAYLSALEKTKLLPSYQPLGQAFFDGICRLPEGGTYPCEEPEAALPRP